MCSLPRHNEGTASFLLRVVGFSCDPFRDHNSEDIFGKDWNCERYCGGGAVAWRLPSICVWRSLAASTPAR